MYLTNEIVNELIAIMGKSVAREMILGKPNVFLYWHEATDMSNAEKFCINIRWVD